MFDNSIQFSDYIQSGKPVIADDVDVLAGPTDTSNFIWPHKSSWNCLSVEYPNETL